MKLLNYLLKTTEMLSFAFCTKIYTDMGGDLALCLGDQKIRTQNFFFETNLPNDLF